MGSHAKRCYKYDFSNYSNCCGGDTTKAGLFEASGFLIGLSNSFTTPYDCGMPDGHLRDVDDDERGVHTLLRLSSER